MSTDSIKRPVASGMRQVTRSRVGTILLLFWLLWGPGWTAVEKVGAQPTSPPRPQRLLFAIPSYSITYITKIVAQQRGFYAEEGLEVKIVQMKAALITKATIAGSVDYSGSAPSGVNATVSGVKIKALMFAYHRPLFDVVSQAGIKSIREFRGKVLGVTDPGGLNDMVTREVLVKNGLVPDREVTLRITGPMPQLFAALRAGSVDGAVLSPPFNLRAQAEGFNRLAWSGQFVEVPMNGFSVMEQRLQQHPQEVQRFTRASLKGLLSYRDSQATAIPIMMDFLQIPDRDFAERLYHYSLEGLSPDGTISLDLQTRLINDARKTLKIERQVRPEEAFDFSFVRRAMAELKASGWRP